MALPPWVLMVAGIVALCVAGWYLLCRLAGPSGERPVLPSHYSSLLYQDRTNYPGHCPSCGTDNEPRYRFCASCGSELPQGGEEVRRSDTATIFSE